MSYLSLQNLNLSFGDNHVVRDFSLEVEKGEFISLLGPSGCGKTTNLRMVAGFETPDSGDIQIEGQSILGMSPRNRNFGMVFQSYALFPNLTVAQNVGFGLKIAKWSKSKIAEQVKTMLEVVGLGDLDGRYPAQLSGGQKQRVALARALAVEPRVLLLDEPLSALDAKIRTVLRTEICEIQQRLGITTIYVTHDQEEALSMSDRIVVMFGGRAEQIGTSQEIYMNPQTRFVASFVGTLSLVDAEILGASRVKLFGEEVTADLSKVSSDKTCLATIRPESFTSERNAESDIELNGKVQSQQYFGSTTRLKVAVESQILSVDLSNRSDSQKFKIGEAITLFLSPADIVYIS